MIRRWRTNNDDLIYRGQVIQAIDDYTKGKPLYEYPYQLIEVIRNVPSAEKTGKWLIPQRRDGMSWNEKAYAECSVCHEVIFNARSMKFCPQCGAKMENNNE